MKNSKIKWMIVLLFLILICGTSLFFEKVMNKKTLTKEEARINASKTQRYTKLVMAFPSQAAGTKDQQMVEDAINEIVRKKLNFEVDLCTFSKDYEQNVNSLIIGNEQLDIAFMYRSMYVNYVTNKQLYELDSLLEHYGQGIINVIGKEVLDTCRVNGKLYGLTNNRDYAVGWDAYILRKDILDKYKIDPSKIKTITNLENVFEIIREKEPNMTVLSSQTNCMLSNCYFSQYDFGVHMENGQSEIVSNLFETEEYKDALKRIRRWRLAGYLDKNVLEQDKTVQERMEEGTLFSFIYRAKPGVEQQETTACGTEVVCVQLGENIVANNAPSSMPWVITKNSISAKKSMLLLNLLYTDPELMNLLSYGIEGIHYVRTSDGHITFPKGKKTNVFMENSWEMPNQFITYIWEGNPLTLWEDIQKFNEEAIQGCDFGFNFDSSKVATEYVALNKIYEKYRYILENGLVNPEVGLKKMNQELKNNSIDKVIAEEQRQFNDWINN